MIKSIRLSPPNLSLYRVVIILLGISSWIFSLPPADGLASESHPGHQPPSALHISGAWSPPAPPMIGVHAGYFTLTNHSSHSQVVVAASSPTYDRVTVHQTTLADGVTSMQSVEALPIAAGEYIQFAPGSFHLMMMNAKNKRHEGETFPVTLHFKSGDSLTFDMAVKQPKQAEQTSSPATDHNMHSAHKHHAK